MIRSYPRLWWLLLILSFLVTGFYYYVPVPKSWSIYLAAASIFIIGIPHGAADHRLFSELYTAHFGARATYKFYAAYLGAIILVVLGWIWLPTLTFLLFILGSSYHFGQGNFQYLGKLSFGSFLLIMVWGAWVILTPVFFHFSTASEVIESLTKTTLAPSVEYYLMLVWYGLTLANGIGILALLKVLSLKECLQEVFTLLVLGCLFWQTPLFLGFGLYFSLWHAGPSVIDQIRFFRLRRKTFWWQQYFLVVLPYSLAAIVGIFIVAYFTGTANVSANIWSIVFGGLAALTLPHLFVLDRVYDRLSRHNSA